MNNKPRYVFDTNVIVSALLLSQSTPDRALQIALERGGLLLSDEVAEELGDVLLRDRFDRYVQRKVREEFLRALILKATFVDIVEIQKMIGFWNWQLMGRHHTLSVVMTT